MRKLFYIVGFYPFLVPRFYSVGFGKLFDSHSYKVFKIADKILLSVEGRTTERKGYALLKGTVRDTLASYGSVPE